MAVPRNRTSNARKNSRRAHHAKDPKQFSTCTNCGKPHTPHRLCNFCGFYNGRNVISSKTEE